MRNAGLDESQTGIKTAGRNINNLRYSDETTLMAESEEELKSLLMRMKEESKKAGLKLNIHKIKISRRNISNLRYADNTILMAESEEELKSPLLKVKEESEKASLNSTFKK